jgi:hypothetical protein
MFFDEHKADTVYQDLLISIAAKQRELLLCRFDWNNRTCKVWPPKGVFGKDKKAIAHYEKLLQELEQLKANTVAHRRKQGYTPGTFWWNLPWDQVENYLIYDLQEINEDGNWRFARKWDLICKDDIYLLLLLEEGHCSMFTGEYSYHYEELSKYSASERDQMARDYNKRLNDYELSQVMWDNDRPVRSAYGTEFASMSDYLKSGEHYMYRDYLDSTYRRSLYTEHHSNKVTVSSRSVHYKCLMNVGGLHLGRNGTPDYVSIMDYDVVSQSGSVPNSLDEEYRQKDAAVALGAYLADHKEFSAIPVELFGRNINESAASYSEAMRQAELYTCLAQKLVFQN